MDAYGLWDLVKEIGEKEIGEKENGSVLNLEILNELIAWDWACSVCVKSGVLPEREQMDKNTTSWYVKRAYLSKEKRFSFVRAWEDSFVTMYAEMMKNKVAAIHKEAEKRRH
ncbi:hypothetical protein ISN44_As07g012010 [Arabidopsis suecica]|uniref:Uncharacterized protein n=1 Tax=Arabidopsis suecica TaxID=45249 RepID=A0A8T2BQZ0_ARASU|nr:hypothetical protein ISN44_As07g012000 [Arabidopsis suecica]KAG7588880.1 hypothetical protein ISN44_As07g012010 [Arabidopsis suecica]